jgi:hypothetical protein
MIDLNIGGACPRRAISYALPRALVCPSGPPDAQLPVPGFGVVAVNGNLHEGVVMFSRIAAQTGRTWLMAGFANDHTSICRDIVLMRPALMGVEITTVHPFIEKDGAAMILLSACATRAFAFDEYGQISDVPPPPRASVSRGADQGWRELKRRMKASAMGDDFWPHESWEIRVA